MHTPSSHLSESKVVKNSSMNQAGASFGEGVSDPVFSFLADVCLRRPPTS